MEEEHLTKKEKRELAKEEKREEMLKQSRNSKFMRLLILVAVLGVIGFGGYKAWKWINTPTEVAEDVSQVSADEWIKGNLDAKVTMIEYGDFQCPACASYYPLIKQVSENNPDDLRVVYRNFPLVNSHPNAFPAARAAEAAGRQGKFWEMHDLLYDRQESWSTERNAKDTFVSYAEELELDMDKFKNDYESSDVENSISYDMVLGNKTGVSYTPTFVINGAIVRLPGSVEGIEEFIKGMIDSNN